jgi:hypothetical protein
MTGIYGQSSQYICSKYAENKPLINEYQDVKPVKVEERILRDQDQRIPEERK